METFAERSQTGFKPPQPYDPDDVPSAFYIEIILPQQRALEAMLDYYPGAILILTVSAWLGWRGRAWWTPIAIYTLCAGCAFLTLGRYELSNILISSHGYFARWLLPWLIVTFLAGRFARRLRGRSRQPRY